MKTPEEWMNQLGKFPNNRKEEDRVYQTARLPENLLPPVALWNSVLTEHDIEAVQLDAKQSGIIEGLEIALRISQELQMATCETYSDYCRGRQSVAYDILDELAKRKKEPEDNQ